LESTVLSTWKTASSHMTTVLKNTKSIPLLNILCCMVWRECCALTNQNCAAFK
jgi:hypothetical protein